MREEVFQLADNIHFGATVTLRYSEGSSSKYICSDGISIRNLITLSQLDNMIDISTALFIIIPPIKFQFEKEMQKVLREKYGKNGDEEFEEKNTIGVIDEFEFQVTQNTEIIEKMRKSPVKYGQNFMLQHLHSCRYLSYSRLSDNSSEYFLELLEIPNQNSYFSFEACYTYQDQISSYIKFESQLYVNMKIESQIQVRDAAINYKRGNILEEWEISFEKKAPLQIGLFQTAEPVQPEFIYFGEPLWIFHLETSSFLKLYNQSASLESFFFRKIKTALNLGVAEVQGDEGQEQNNIFLQRTKNELSAEKLGLWKIESVNRFQGGKIKFDNEVRLFNIRYKIYLSVQKMMVKKKTTYCVSTERYHSDNTLFRMKPLSASSNYVTSSDLIIFEHILSNTCLGVNLDIVNLQQETHFQISPNLKYKNQDNFKFTKASFMQNWQNNFVISVLPFVEEGSNMLEKIRTRPLRKKQESFLMFLRETLIEVMNFSEDLSECFEISDNKLGKVSFNHFLIQKILREQGFLQLICTMLNRIDPLIFRKRKTQYEQQFRLSGLSQILLNFLSSSKYNENEIELDLFLMQSIVRIALKFLANATKYNVESSIIMFQYLPVCIKFLGLRIGAEDFFYNFFKNNQFLHSKENIPFNEVIAQYKGLKTSETEYFPDMFSVFISLLKDGDDQGNAKNQTTLFDLLIVKKSILLLPIFNINERLFVHFKGESHELQEFVRTSAASNPRIVEMIIRQIQFYSQLVFGRNYVCSKHFKEIFTFRAISNYLSTEIDSNIRASLVSLMTTCYIDERPRFQQNFPNLTYSFREVHANSSIQYSHEFQDHQKEKQKQKRKYQDVIQLTRTKSMNLQQNVIRELLDTISLKDSISASEMDEIKKWIVDTINNYIQMPSIEQFYERLNFATLNCLKRMIELSVFTSRQNDEIHRLILSIIRKLKQSMNKQQDVTQISSTNFNEILRQMLAKNILKKFNNRSRFDGLQDEITISNISLRFVKFAYYQNLFLFKGINHQKDNVIETVLALINNSTQLRIDQRIRTLIQDLKEAALNNLDSNDSQTSKLINRFIKENLIARSLRQWTRDQHQSLMESLLLHFYQSNKYDINEKALTQVLALVFENKYFVRCLQKTIIIADPHLHSVYEKIKQSYFNVKLLIETCEVWMTPDYEDPKFIYNPVVHHMIDKLNLVMHLLIDESPHKVEDILLMSRYEKVLEQFGVSVQRQIILRNMMYANEVFLFLRINVLMITQLKNRTERNRSVYDLFQTCFNFIYMYILDCRDTKDSIKVHFGFLLQLVNNCQVQLGQTHILIEYLKDNYDESLNFINIHLQGFINRIIREGRYNYLSVKLIKTISKYYQQPVPQALKKLFFWLFDIGTFRRFMFIVDSNQTGSQSSIQSNNQPQNGISSYVFQMDLSLLKQSHMQPIFYQIEAIDVLLFTRDHLEESKNILKTNIKNTLGYSYLFQLLGQKDYFSDQNSPDPQLRLSTIFKCKLLQLIQKIYLMEEQQTAFYQQLKQFLISQISLFETFLEEFDIRKETNLFRKVSIGTSPRRRQDQLIKLVEEKLLQFVRINTNYFVMWKKVVGQFCEAIEKYSNNVKGLEICRPSAKAVTNLIYRLNRMLYESEEKPVTNIELPYRWMIKPVRYKDQQANKTHNFTSACILQAMISKDVEDQVRKLSLSMMEKLQPTLRRISINMFNFFRKIAEFIEDTIEKLIENEDDIDRSKIVKNLLRFLRMCLQVGTKQKQQEIRMLMGKSELIFPFMNYLEITKLNRNNTKILKLFIELLNELLSEQGNKIVQKILHQYFSNKPESFELFFKIKLVVGQMDFEKAVKFKSRNISTAIQQLKKQARGESSSEYSMLQFLILLCRGNNKKNQLFLTSLNKLSGFDVIKILLSLLRIHTNQSDGIPLVNLKNYTLIMQCFETIRALVEGPCNQNQDLFVSSSFFEIALKYFKFQVDSDKEVALGVNISTPNLVVVDQISQVSQNFSEKIMYMLKLEYEVNILMVSQIKFKCISTIMSLLEENLSDNAINKLVLSIPAQQIVNNINKVYQRYLDKQMKYEQQNLQLHQEKELVLPLGFKMYFVLEEYVEKGLEILMDTQPLKFFKQHTKTIEVVHSRLFTLRFPEPPLKISNVFKKEFLEQADRTSINSKLKDLQQTQIQNRSSQPGWLLFFCVLIINILDIIIYRDSQISFVKDFQFNLRPLEYSSNRDIAAEQITQQVFNVSALIMSLVFYVMEFLGTMYIRRKIIVIYHDNTKTKWEKFVSWTKLFFNNINCHYYLLISILLVLGMFTPLFDTLALVCELFKRNETFFEIGKAIIESLGQLLVVLLILLISNYILVIFIYYYYANSYSPCTNTLYQCLSFGLDIALKQDYGVVGFNDNADTLLTDFLGDNAFDVVFDFFYLFIIKIIVQQVLGAIIVDKFAQIREQTQKRQADEETKCYICGMDVELFDREEDGFEKHKEQYHNIWNYFYFLVYLQNSKVKDLSGVELFVHNCKKQGELRWFPINRSLHLEKKRKLNEIVAVEADQRRQEDNEQKMIDIDLEYLKKSMDQLNQLVNYKLFQKEMQE